MKNLPVVFARVRLSLVLLLAGSCVGLAPVAEAKDKPASPPTKAERLAAAQSKYDAFLEHHPRLGQTLQAHPGMADNPRFLANHPKLATFLRHHPKLASHLAKNTKAAKQRRDEVGKN
jgi:hypothetical protein